MILTVFLIGNWSEIILSGLIRIQLDRLDKFPTIWVVLCSRISDQILIGIWVVLTDSAWETWGTDKTSLQLCLLSKSFVSSVDSMIGTNPNLSLYNDLEKDEQKEFTSQGFVHPIWTWWYPTLAWVPSQSSHQPPGLSTQPLMQQQWPGYLQVSRFSITRLTHNATCYNFWGFLTYHSSQAKCQQTSNTLQFFMMLMVNLLCFICISPLLIFLVQRYISVIRSWHQWGWWCSTELPTWTAV